MMKRSKTKRRSVKRSAGVWRVIVEGIADGMIPSAGIDLHGGSMVSDDGFAADAKALERDRKSAIKKLRSELDHQTRVRVDKVLAGQYELHQVVLLGESAETAGLKDQIRERLLARSDIDDHDVWIQDGNDWAEASGDAEADYWAKGSAEAGVRIVGQDAHPNVKVVDRQWTSDSDLPQAARLIALDPSCVTPDARERRRRTTGDSGGEAQQETASRTISQS